MSEDIDRLNKVLEDLRITNDTLVGQCEVMADVFAAVTADVFAAVTAVDKTVNPEAYGDLVAILREFQPEFNRLVKSMFDMHLYISMVHSKVGA